MSAYDWEEGDDGDFEFFRDYMRGDVEGGESDELDDDEDWDDDEEEVA